MSSLTFYGARGAPNPRRVEIFMHEMGLLEGLGYSYVDVNMTKGEHRRGGAHATPNRKLPMLKIRSGDLIAESVAICRYIDEAEVPESAIAAPRLFGSTVVPLQRAQIEMWTRRVELELLVGAVGKAWIHGPVVAPLRSQLGLEGVDSELRLGLRLAQAFYRELDAELAQRPFLAGDEFSIADITLLCILDFGAGPVKVPMLWEEWPNLAAWHRCVSARPSVRAHPNPYITGEQRYSSSKSKL